MTNKIIDDLKEGIIMEENMFNELIESVNEAIEHEKGNIDLKSNIITIDDDIIDKYNQLSTDNQQTVKILIDRLLSTNNDVGVEK